VWPGLDAFLRRLRRLNGRQLNSATRGRRCQACRPLHLRIVPRQRRQRAVGRRQRGRCCRAGCCCACWQLQQLEITALGRGGVRNWAQGATAGRSHLGQQCRAGGGGSHSRAGLSAAGLRSGRCVQRTCPSAARCQHEIAPGTAAAGGLLGCDRSCRSGRGVCVRVRAPLRTSPAAPCCYCCCCCCQRSCILTRALLALCSYNGGGWCACCSTASARVGGAHTGRACATWDACLGGRVECGTPRQATDARALRSRGRARDQQGQQRAHGSRWMAATTSRAPACAHWPAQQPHPAGAAMTAGQGAVLHISAAAAAAAAATPPPAAAVAPRPHPTPLTATTALRRPATHARACCPGPVRWPRPPSAAAGHQNSCSRVLMFRQQWLEAIGCAPALECSGHSTCRSSPGAGARHHSVEGLQPCLTCAET
jgi:hypothetical protein